MPWFDNSTGFYTGMSIQGIPSYCVGTKNEIFISKQDKDKLRKLAYQVADLANQDIQEEKRKLWHDHNDLKTKYPVIFCDPENGWNEIINEDMLNCEGFFAKKWEYVLLMRLFSGTKMLDDNPIEAIFDLTFSYTDSEWGIYEKYQGDQTGGSYAWDWPIKNEDDIEKIQDPIITIDYKTSIETFILANQVFEDILKVRLVNYWWWTFGMSLDLIRLIGFENTLFFMTDKPEFIHRVMKKLTEGFMNKLDYLENNNLLTLNNAGHYIGTGALGYTNELPKSDIDNFPVKVRDLWGNAESQETVGVSPKMFEEFIFTYQIKILKRFGLNCYGCCEPVDRRWDIIKKIPNLRRVSVSAWADRSKMAENLKDNFIYSWKPRPADIAVKNIDKDSIRKYIRETLQVTKGCVLELVMKDNHTLGKNPQNIIDWVKIAREEVAKVY